MPRSNFEQNPDNQEIGHQQSWFFIEKIESFRSALLPINEELGLWPYGYVEDSDYWRHRDLSGKFNLGNNKELSLIISEEEVRLENVIQEFRVHAAMVCEHFEGPIGKNKIVTSYSVTQETSPVGDITTTYSSNLYSWDEKMNQWKKVRTRLEELWHTLAENDREKGSTDFTEESLVAWLAAYREQEEMVAGIGQPDVFTQDRFNEIMDVLDGLGR